MTGRDPLLLVTDDLIYKYTNKTCILIVNVLLKETITYPSSSLSKVMVHVSFEHPLEVVIPTTFNCLLARRIFYVLTLTIYKIF